MADEDKIKQLLLESKDKTIAINECVTLLGWSKWDCVEYCVFEFYEKILKGKCDCKDKLNCFFDETHKIVFDFKSISFFFEFTLSCKKEIYSIDMHVCGVIIGISKLHKIKNIKKELKEYMTELKQAITFYDNTF